MEKKALLKDLHSYVIAEKNVRGHFIIHDEDEKHCSYCAVGYLLHKAGVPNKYIKQLQNDEGVDALKSLPNEYADVLYDAGFEEEELEELISKNDRYGDRSDLLEYIEDHLDVDEEVNGSIEDEEDFDDWDDEDDEEEDDDDDEEESVSEEAAQASLFKLLDRTHEGEADVLLEAIYAGKIYGNSFIKVDDQCGCLIGHVMMHRGVKSGSMRDMAPHIRQMRGRDQDPFYLRHDRIGDNTPIEEYIMNVEEGETPETSKVLENVVNWINIWKQNRK